MTAVFTQIVVLSPDALFHEVGGEVVILDLKSEQYFGLDETGARAWQLLQESSDIQALYDGMLKDFNVDPEVLNRDIQDLIKELLDAGLVQIESD